MPPTFPDLEAILVVVFHQPRDAVIESRCEGCRVGGVLNTVAQLRPGVALVDRKCRSYCTIALWAVQMLHRGRRRADEG